MSKAALVVDDSSTMRQMVAFTLRRAGFEITEASDGKMALAELDKQFFHLIITDLNMPELDGVGLIRAARKHNNYRYTPILMLTTESQENKRQEGRQAGATAWVVKPFDPNKLLAAIAKLVRDVQPCDNSA
jgi:two-component system, chemotaxis family, chemotaxis protein CheY